LPRLYEASSGTILIDGQAITDVTLNSLRSQISLVSQDVVLLNDSIGNNIRYCRPDASDEDVHRAVREAALMPFVDSLPDGLSTEVGQGGVQLSGGQRQRISIARAFLRHSPIIILDEVTSSLDAESEYEVQQAIERLRQGRTTIIIAHRFKSVETADLILVLEGGRIVQRGTHLELLEQSGLYRDLHERAHRKGTEADD
jgi:subfamily B ATP-binding cassette protein MsbA